MRRFSARAASIAAVIALASFAVAAQTAKAPQSPTQSQMKAAVQAFVDARITAQNDKARLLFADDARIEDPLGTSIKTPDQFLFGGPGAGKNKLNIETLLITGSDTNVATASIVVKIPGGRVNNVLVFTFRPDGKISDMKGYFGSEDRITDPKP